MATNKAPLIRHLQVGSDSVHGREIVQFLIDVLSEHGVADGALEGLGDRLHEILLRKRINLPGPLFWRLVVSVGEHLLSDLLAVDGPRLEVHEDHRFELVLRTLELLVGRRLR